MAALHQGGFRKAAPPPRGPVGALPAPAAAEGDSDLTPASVRDSQPPGWLPDRVSPRRPCPTRSGVCKPCRARCTRPSLPSGSEQLPRCDGPACCPHCAPKQPWGSGSESARSRSAALFVFNVLFIYWGGGGRVEGQGGRENPKQALRRGAQSHKP